MTKQIVTPDEARVPSDARPAYFRAAGSTWHVALHDSSQDNGQDMCLVYPDYDDDQELDYEGVYVRMDTLQIDDDGDAVATSQLWEVRDLARFCRNTLALLNADQALARAANAETPDDLDDDEDDETEEEDAFEDEDDDDDTEEEEEDDDDDDDDDDAQDEDDEDDDDDDDDDKEDEG